MNVLILGSGGREHTFAWKIAQSNHLEKLFIAPGNAGTSQVGENLSIDISSKNAIKQAVLDNEITMVVAGPEAPLVDGVADFFKEDPQLKQVVFIGPSAEGAKLEGSKDHAKAFMARHEIPTAAYKTFDISNLNDGYEFLEELKAPYVLKADGLAAGKGVLIIDDLDEAKTSLKQMIEDQKFGDASSSVVIEEFLDGIELSVFVLTDGHNYIILPEAKDYKRIGEGDTGLNTGGMGAISPVPFADKKFMDKVEKRIVKPTIEGLEKESVEYKGFVFIGLMKVGNDPLVVEYNVRMGDPETEVVFPRVKGDLLEAFDLVGRGKADEIKLDSDARTAMTVVAVSGGYPGSYEKGKEITGTNSVGDAIVFHAGTKSADGKLLTNGGRVLAVTCLADSVESAREKCYSEIGKIRFDGVYYRKDIGKDLIAYSQEV